MKFKIGDFVSYINYENKKRYGIITHIEDTKIWCFWFDSLKKAFLFKNNKKYKSFCSTRWPTWVEVDRVFLETFKIEPQLYGIVKFCRKYYENI
jgi:hypothetical protein